MENISKKPIDKYTWFVDSVTMNTSWLSMSRSIHMYIHTPNIC